MGIVRYEQSNLRALASVPQRLRAAQNAKNLTLLDLARMMSVAQRVMLNYAEVGSGNYQSVVIDQHRLSGLKVGMLPALAQACAMPITYFVYDDQLPLAHFCHQLMQIDRPIRRYLFNLFDQLVQMHVSHRSQYPHLPELPWLGKEKYEQRVKLLAQRLEIPPLEGIKYLTYLRIREEWPLGRQLLEQIGLRLLEQVNSQGVSYQELAALYGLEPYHYYYILRGQLDLPLRLLVGLAQRLNVPLVYYFLDLEIRSSQLSRVFNQLNELPEAEIAYVAHLGSGFIQAYIQQRGKFPTTL